MKSPKRPRTGSLDLWKAVRLYTEDLGSQCLLADHVSFIQGLIRARDIDRLASIGDVLGFCYSDPMANRVLSQIAAFVKKDADLADEARCVEEARKNFFIAEGICRETNDRLVSFYKREPFMTNDDKEYEQLLLVRRMRSYIRRLCGSRGSFLDSLPKGAKVTSGATRGLPRKLSLPYRKVKKKAEGTSLATHLFRLFQTSVGMTPWALTDVEGNRITLVLKSYKTHRTIAAEPEVNLTFQLSVDHYLKRRLLKVGIDLTNQEINKQLAREASIYDHLATMDLSMASDTMALELIPFLFPTDWTQFFLQLRSPRYSGVFGDGIYQKFSSMGNGMTFALETIIFWAAAKAVGSKVVSVYGDDIVIDADKFQELSDLLNFLGFIPNEAKSFHTGPFRESCGGDYFRGEDIRPFFVKKHKRLSKPEMCHYVNGLVGLGSQQLADYLRSSLVRKYRLPLVPLNEDSRSGVHITIGGAHELKLIRSYLHQRGDWIPSFEGYSEAGRIRCVADVRTMILWFLQKVTYPDTPYVASEVLSSTTVRYKRMCWRIPSTTPAHLYWWTDQLLRG